MGSFNAACWHGCKWLGVYDGSQPCAKCNESNDYQYFEQKEKDSKRRK